MDFIHSLKVHLASSAHNNGTMFANFAGLMIPQKITFSSEHLNKHRMRCTNMRHKEHLFIYFKWFIALITGLSLGKKTTTKHNFMLIPHWQQIKWQKLFLVQRKGSLCVNETQKYSVLFSDHRPRWMARWFHTVIWGFTIYCICVLFVFHVKKGHLFGNWLNQRS